MTHEELCERSTIGEVPESLVWALHCYVVSKQGEVL